MARIKHPVDVFSGACSVEPRLSFRRGENGAGVRGGGWRKKIFPKDVNTNEAKSSPLAGWAETSHGARWWRRRPYGGWRWRRDATQGRLTLLRPRTDRRGSRAGTPRSASSIWAGVLRVRGAAACCSFLSRKYQFWTMLVSLLKRWKKLVETTDLEFFIYAITKIISLRKKNAKFITSILIVMRLKLPCSYSRSYLQGRVLWDLDLPTKTLAVPDLSFPMHHLPRYLPFFSVPPSNVRFSSTWLYDFETTPGIISNIFWLNDD